jgi:heme-degrading monooxygenase HmoA
MYAIATSTQVQPGKIDEATAVFRDFVTPAFKLSRGFKGALLLIDPATGKAVAMSLWETEADRDAVRSNSELLKQLGRLAKTLIAPPSPIFCEVKALTFIEL